MAFDFGEPREKTWQEKDLENKNLKLQKKVKRLKKKLKV